MNSLMSCSHAIGLYQLTLKAFFSRDFSLLLFLVLLLLRYYYYYYYCKQKDVLHIRSMNSLNDMILDMMMIITSGCNALPLFRCIGRLNLTLYIALVAAAAA